MGEKCLDVFDYLYHRANPENKTIQVTLIIRPGLTFLSSFSGYAFFLLNQDTNYVSLGDRVGGGMEEVLAQLLMT